MSTNPRTLRLVTALVERHPEFRAVKPEWWNDTSFELGRTDDSCTAPDLTDRRNLADLFDVCDWLNATRSVDRCKAEVLWFYPDREFRASIHAGTLSGATRTDALLAAAEDALGLDKCEEVVGG